jgi:hypothetical protein
VDFPDAVAAGFGVTEYDSSRKAAQEIQALWRRIVALLIPDKTQRSKRAYFED